MIYLPPPQPVVNKDIRVSGDVEIHPTASLAPGVILQASADCSIVIGADVCIGMGVIINASQGSVEIDSGAILGSGVLIIGECKIGSNACLGTAVTIFQVNVEPMTVIEPGSVLGDSSRKVDLSKPDHQQKQQRKTDSSFSTSQVQSKASQRKVGNNGYYSPSQAKKKENTQGNINQQDSSFSTTTKKTNKTTVDETETTVRPKAKSDKDPVVGQVYINQLLVTLFPHNKDLDSRAKKLE